MKLEKIKVVKNDDRGTIYDCGKSNFIFRKKGTVSANHTHADYEIIYLVKGKLELTIGDETKIVQAPVRFGIPPNVYHKLIAHTDIDIVINRNSEK